MIIQSEDISLLTEVGAIVQEVRDDSTAGKTDIGKLMRIPTPQGAIEIKRWGHDNQLPTRREELIAGSNIVGALISTKSNISVGGNIYVYRERIEDTPEGEMRRIIDEVPMPAEISDFIEASGEHRYFALAAAQLFKQGNPFTELVPSRTPSVFGAKNHIAYMKAHEAKFIRAERMDSFGRVNNYYYRGNAWSKGRDTDFPIRKIAAYDPTGANDKPFMYHTGDPLMRSDDYYFDPIWWGAKTWVNTANIVPQFHIANFRNGYTLRFHIRIPKNYFDDADWSRAITAEQKKDFAAIRAERKAAFLRTLNEFLAGVEQSGRAIVTEYVVDAVKGQFPGIEILPITVDLKDGALLDLFEKANQAVISSMQIHPTLANIETQGRLSSGTEIRNAFLMYVAIQTPLPRRIIFEPLYLAAKINGWDKGLKFGFRDADLTRLSEDKSGVKEKDPSKNMG